MTHCISTSGYGKTEEHLNALTHGLGFVMAVFGMVYLLSRAQGQLAVGSVAVYGASLMLMFLASTMYHWAPASSLKNKLKLLDHAAIYILIAGTYTPFMLVSLDGWIGWIGFVVIWSVALFGLIFKWKVGSRYPKVSVALYLCMGWLVALLIYPLYQAIEVGGLWLLLAGGLLFSLGVIFYVAKHKAYSHAIWHCFVVAGCSCHFFSIYHFVI